MQTHNARTPFAGRRTQLGSHARLQRVAHITVQAAAPATGHHVIADDLRREALAQFFERPCNCTPTTGGVNNVVQYVEDDRGQRIAVLRVYNNGGHSEKVAFEHALLAQLGKQKLTFQVPRALPALKDGAPFVKLSSGDDACVFEIIPGSLAKTTSPREVGRATGELCTAMGTIDMGGREEQAPVPPYYDVFRAHHAMDRALFYQQVAENSGFDVCRASIDYLVDQLRDLEPRLETYKALGLPKQLIHGDLHFDNVMVDGDRVSGLLDFEFTAYDWRAMELAVALSKYVGIDDPLPLIRDFVSGYALHGALGPQEVEIMPDLIALRILSNVVYFTGRAYAGEDGLDSLTSRAGSYAKRVVWIDANRAAIVGALQELLLAPAGVAA